MYEYMRTKFEMRDEMKLYAELEEKLTRLDPINWDDGFKFLAEVEKFNGAIKAIEPDNARNETQLKIFVYGKINKAEIGAINAWSDFLNDFNKNGVLAGKSYADFKEEFCNHWQYNGNPGDPKGIVHKAMTMTAVTEDKRDSNGISTCGTCNQKGHISKYCWEDEKNSHKRPEWWKPKEARGIGYGTFHGTCFVCGKRGHRAIECPDKKAKGDQSGETGLVNFFAMSVIDEAIEEKNVDKFEFLNENSDDDEGEETGVWHSQSVEGVARVLVGPSEEWMDK
jgi:hypothetical protein